MAREGVELNKIGPAQLSGWQNTARNIVLLLAVVS